MFPPIRRSGFSLTGDTPAGYPNGWPVFTDAGDGPALGIRSGAGAERPNKHRSEQMMKATCKCGAAWSGDKPEHCTECHRTFGSSIAGELHRVGDHGVRQGPNRRRCMTDEEMAAKQISKGVDAGQPWYASRVNNHGTVIWFRNIPSRVPNPNWERSDSDA